MVDGDGRSRSGSDEDGDETEDELRERYRELLEELRTIIPGVTVVLAFLLTVPFSSRFTELDGAGTTLFAASLTSSTLSVVVFLVPAAYHRLTSHRQREERMRVGVRATLAGLALFAAAIVLALLVVGRLIFGGVVAGLLAGLVLGAIVGLWFVLPALRERSRDRSGRRSEQDDGDA